ncbi:melanoregulin-like isoform X2 [Varanus komodoensis]|uniref:melanoregulin-like isoform X2 n=1 Tax=Varanus komodoensis TaxID=61221 RepID=UPI001CF78609|nr:melanoregulin-like isoform X2 [Varanus komodoensis]
MDFWYKLCCCCCHREEELEKNPLIISEVLQCFNKLQKRRRSEAANLWNEPVDSTHMERDDDRELYMLLQKRSKVRRGSEDYRRLSFDIIAHRQIRRKMKDHWKQVLDILGFKAEAEELLTVTSSTSYESLRNPAEARTLLDALAEQTTIFGRHCGGPPERYLFVLGLRLRKYPSPQETASVVTCHEIHGEPPAMLRIGDGHCDFRLELETRHGHGCTCPARSNFV